MSTVTMPGQTELHAPRAPARRVGRRYIRIVSVVAVAAGLFTAAYFGWGRSAIGTGRAIETHVVKRRTFPIVLNEKGELQAKESVAVKCEVEGRSTIIWLIPEGTEVKKGEVLVKLASNEIEEKIQAEQINVRNAEATAEAEAKELDILMDQNASDIRQAALKLKNAGIELTKYREGDYKQTLTDKQLALEKATKILDQQEGIEADSRKLRDEGYITSREYEKDALDLYEARVNKEKAELDLEIFEKYTHPKDKEQKESDVSEAEKELERIRKQADAKEAKQRATKEAKQEELNLVRQRLAKYTEQQQKTTIAAPADGLVVYDTGENRWNQREIAEGAEVYERQTIIQLPDPTVMQVKLRIHEAKTDKISKGLRANVEVEGVPGVTFTGEVTRIAPLADSQGSWLNPDLKEYDATVTLDKTKHDLKPGVTARTEILVDVVESALTVPIQCVYSSGPKSYVFVGRSQDSAEPVQVKTGRSSDEYVEITDGITEGDVVLLAMSEQMVLKIPSNHQDRDGLGDLAELQQQQQPKQQQPAPKQRGASHRPAGGKSQARGGRGG